MNYLPKKIIVQQLGNIYMLYIHIFAILSASLFSTIKLGLLFFLFVLNNAHLLYRHKACKNFKYSS